MESSILARLPAELRNSIYEYSLQEGLDGPETVYIGRDRNFDRAPCKLKAYQSSENDGPLFLSVCGLPATCRQLRAETLALYYAINRFHFQTEYLKSDSVGKDRIIKEIKQWTEAVHHARDMRDVTISLASFKGPPTTDSLDLKIDWDHMRTVRQLFHPRGRLHIRFYLEGSKTATFTLGSRESVARQLDRMAEIWCARWQRTRKYSEVEARTVAELYRAEIGRLFVDMPDEV